MADCASDSVSASVSSFHVGDMVSGVLESSVRRARRVRQQDPLTRRQRENKALRDQVNAAQQDDIRDEARAARGVCAEHEASERAHLSRTYKTETSVLHMDARRERDAKAADVERSRAAKEQAEALRRLQGALKEDVDAARSASRGPRRAVSPAKTVSTSDPVSPARARAKALRSEIHELRQQREKAFVENFTNTQHAFESTMDRECEATKDRSHKDIVNRSQSVKERADRERSTKQNASVAKQAEVNRVRATRLRQNTAELQKSVIRSREQFRAMTAEPSKRTSNSSEQQPAQDARRTRTPALEPSTLEDAVARDEAVERRREELAEARVERLRKERQERAARERADADRKAQAEAADRERRERERREAADASRAQAEYRKSALDASREQRQLQKELAAAQAARLAHRVAERVGHQHPSDASQADSSAASHGADHASATRQRERERQRDIAKHREMTVLRKRAAEAEEEKQRAVAVEHFRTQRGSGSGAKADAEVARDERQRVFAERRRRDALEAAAQREAKQERVLEEKRRAAMELREQEAELEERRIVSAAEAEWEKRDRVERARVARAAAVGPTRYQQRLFTPHLLGARSASPAQVSTISAMSPIPADGEEPATGALDLLVACSSTPRLDCLALMARAAEDGTRAASQDPPQQEEESGAAADAGPAVSGLDCMMSAFAAAGESPPTLGLIADAIRGLAANDDGTFHAAATPASPTSTVRRAQHLGVTSPDRRQKIRLEKLDEQTLRVQGVAEFPTKLGIAQLRERGASKPVVSAAERLLQLREEQEQLQRDINKRRRDVLAVRRDRAVLDAKSRGAHVGVSKRLTERTLLQDASRAGILAAIDAERVARATSDGEEGETMATRHAARGKIAGCSRALYDPRKIEAAKERQKERHMLASVEAEERQAALDAPRGPGDEKVIRRFHTAPLARSEMEREKLATREKKRFEEATLAKARGKQEAEQRDATVARLSKPILRPDPEAVVRKKQGASPKLDKASLQGVTARVYDGAVGKQQAENKRLEGEYLQRPAPVKLPPMVLKTSAQRMYEGKRE